jgi:hypothetical protein
MRKTFISGLTPNSIIANGMSAVEGIARANSNVGDTMRSTNAS